MKRIYKAINEGIKLIDFGNNKILKSQKIDTGLPKFNSGDIIYYDEITDTLNTQKIGEEVAFCISDIEGHEIYAPSPSYVLESYGLSWANNFDSKLYLDVTPEFGNGWDNTLYIRENYDVSNPNIIWSHLKEYEYIPSVYDFEIINKQREENFNIYAHTIKFSKGPLFTSSSSTDKRYLGNVCIVNDNSGYNIQETSKICSSFSITCKLINLLAFLKYKKNHLNENINLIDFGNNKILKSQKVDIGHISKFKFGDFVYYDRQNGYNNLEKGEKVAVCVNDEHENELYIVLNHFLYTMSDYYWANPDTDLYKDRIPELDTGWERTNYILLKYKGTNSIKGTIWNRLKTDEYIPTLEELEKAYKNIFDDTDHIHDWWSIVPFHGNNWTTTLKSEIHLVKTILVSYFNYYDSESYKFSNKQSSIVFLYID